MHCLEVLFRVGGREVGGVPDSVGFDPPEPNICGRVVCEPPSIVNGGDQQEDDAGDVEEKDAC